MASSAPPASSRRPVSVAGPVGQQRPVVAGEHEREPEWARCVRRVGEALEDHERARSRTAGWIRGGLVRTARGEQCAGRAEAADGEGAEATQPEEAAPIHPHGE